ncbi:hypothetical protein RRG08_000566 [Elysia crispata]|uniref:Uncharacterized protein n=1 Tax=Elysia crispata TaxID=231223 RepID=A0AAE0Y887_9GAST|nr:hypothetical protein RRG08_000566 [Elysia crispata]
MSAVRCHIMAVDVISSQPREDDKMRSDHTPAEPRFERATSLPDQRSTDYGIWNHKLQRFSVAAETADRL